jgi:DNA-binding GntR family transcriptional regulator
VPVAGRAELGVDLDPLQAVAVGRAPGALDRKDVEDLYVLREQLEGLAVRLAAERRRWRSFVREQCLPAFSEANRAFHQTLIEASGNRHLPDMLDRTLVTLFASQFRAWVAPPDTVRAAQQHLAILDAIEAGDGAAAERTMRGQVRDSAAMILRLEDEVFD